MLKIGNAPLSWGVFEGEAPGNPPWELVLDEIAAAGYRRTELGPIGFLPEDVDLLRDALSQRGLTLSAGFVYEHMHDPAKRQRVLDSTRRVGRILRALGAQYLVVIDRMTPQRQRTAGRNDAAERLPTEVWDVMLSTIAEAARIARDEFGLRPVLHPHCGTHVEFADEIERALAELPDDLVGLCIDTAHAAVAGLQAADLVECYPDRVEYFHIKDVDPAALERLWRERLDFDTALGIGLFCPVGRGMVDFDALRARLVRIGFDGSATVEQDPDPREGGHDGLAAARESLAFLHRTGLAYPDEPSLAPSSPEEAS